ncbi:MAG: hypothetical protein KAV00_07110 [Phycisphaerae bacterium]|nr:hypothetical protein [Phycisphaerae bacterium]
MNHKVTFRGGPLDGKVADNWFGILGASGAMFDSGGELWEIWYKRESAEDNFVTFVSLSQDHWRCEPCKAYWRHGFCQLDNKCPFCGHNLTLTTIFIKAENWEEEFAKLSGESGRTAFGGLGSTPAGLAAISCGDKR